MKNNGESMSDQEKIKKDLYEEFKEAARNQEQGFKKYAELKSRVDDLSEKDIQDQIYERYKRNKLAEKYSDAEEKQGELAEKYLDYISEIMTERDILHNMIFNHHVDIIENFIKEIQLDEYFTDEHQVLLDAIKEQDKLMFQLRAELEKADLISNPVQAFLDEIVKAGYSERNCTCKGE